MFGVFGALLVFAWRRHADIPRDILKSVRGGALSLCIYSLAMGYVMPYVDNAAHVGGLLGGAFAGLLLVRPFEPAAREKLRPWGIVAVALGICGILAALAAPLLIHGYRVAEHADDIRGTLGAICGSQQESAGESDARAGWNRSHFADGFGSPGGRTPG